MEHRTDEGELTARLAIAIQSVLNAADDIPLPWVGDSIHTIMAEAALAVLRGIADSQDYLRDNDMLNDDPA
jgi:hypothetical protein